MNYVQSVHFDGFADAVKKTGDYICTKVSAFLMWLLCVVSLDSFNIILYSHRSSLSYVYKYALTIPLCVFLGTLSIYMYNLSCVFLGRSNADKPGDTVCLQYLLVQPLPELGNS